MNLSVQHKQNSYKRLETISLILPKNRSHEKIGKYRV